MTNTLVLYDFQEAFTGVQIITDDLDDILDESIDELLEFIDQAQAKAYTQDSNPAKPSNSRYIRTFNLQNSTEKVHVSRFEGEWVSDIEYAHYVLGSKSEQAPIHVGRWKSKEMVIQETISNAPRIINELIGRKL